MNKYITRATTVAVAVLAFSPAYAQSDTAKARLALHPPLCQLPYQQTLPIALQTVDRRAYLLSSDATDLCRLH